MALSKEETIKQYLRSVNFQQSADEYELSGPIQNVPSIPQFIQFDADEVCLNEEFLQHWPTFMKDLSDTPEKVIKLWSLTTENFVSEVLNDEHSDEDDDDPVRVMPLKVGFFRAKPLTPVNGINCSTIGTYVTLEGAVVRMGSVQIHCSQMTYICKRCDFRFALPQPNGLRVGPKRCQNRDCKNTTSFEFDEHAATTMIMDSRTLRLQDKLDNVEAGGIPSTVECLLLGDQIAKCAGGDLITLSGIVKTRPVYENWNAQPVLRFFIEVYGIKQNNDIDRSAKGTLIQFTDNDYYAIRAIFGTPELFRFLIHSFCPSLYGLELVKAGLLLSLFGGLGDSGFIKKRSNIHVLMIGDPGLGKSQLLKVVTEVAPKGIFVCGSGSTVAGLTVTVVKDGNDNICEAGAMVLANKGVCCIDEFDKMSSQHNALLEAMEQQCVTIAKAGMFRVFPAETTVIAAGNPKEGHYDSKKSLHDNVQISVPLLSRFDLIFIMRDIPNEKQDRKLFEHVRDFRREANPQISAKATTPNPSTSMAEEGNVQVPVPPVNAPLMDRCKPRENEVLDLLPTCLLRKYIAYARQHVHPKLTDEAGSILKKYYEELRKGRTLIHSTPVTIRLLESLVRLTEARAKSELRETATAQDARDVLEIFEHSIAATLKREERNNLEFEFAVPLPPQTPTPSSSKKKSPTAEAMMLLNELRIQSRATQKSLFSNDEIRQYVSKLGLKTGHQGLIAKLNYEGYIIKKSERTYQLQKNAE